MPGRGHENDGSSDTTPDRRRGTELTDAEERALAAQKAAREAAAEAERKAAEEDR